jgi:hypothetical protein
MLFLYCPSLRSCVTFHDTYYTFRFLKSKEFPDWLNNYQLFMEDPEPKVGWLVTPHVIT